MLILPFIGTESKMFENPFHLHFLTRVLFLKYRKYCDPYHMCICEKEKGRGFDRDRIQGFQGSRIQVKKVQKSEVQKSKSPEVRRATAENGAEV